jgi:hypothetical protein
MIVALGREGVAVTPDEGADYRPSASVQAGRLQGEFKITDTGEGLEQNLARHLRGERVHTRQHVTDLVVGHDAEATGGAA